MRICVIGLGYAGLVTAAGFAAYGHDVAAFDIDAKRVNALAAGGAPPFHEPGLGDLLRAHAGNITYTTLEGAAMEGADVAILAVGTPTAQDGESADLAQLRAATLAVAPYVKATTVLAIKSTVPPGTNLKVREWLLERGAACIVANLPEFLREGTAVADVLRPDRVVIGTESPLAADVLSRLHRPMVRSERDILVMRPASAELTKYASNAMLATRISFMNDLAALAEVVGGDIREVARGVGADSRIGPQYLHAGVGWGGSCFGKDVRALVRVAKDQDIDLWVAEAADKVNTWHRRRFSERVIDALGGPRGTLATVPDRGPLHGKSVCVLGLSFKPDTDDVRDSPALDIVRDLLAAGARVCAHDPVAGAKFAAALHDEDERFLVYARPQAAIAGAQALVLVTEWREYRVIDWPAVLATMAAPRLVFDGRNVWNREEVEAAGGTYYGVGR